MKLTWQRTVIGGQTKPSDFSAHDAGKHVGRICCHDTGVERDLWFWTMNAFGPSIDRSGVNCNGIVETKAKAVRLVEETYRRCRVT